VVPGFSHLGRKDGEFKNSLWIELKDKDISLIEALCYDNGQPTIKPIREYSGRLSNIIQSQMPEAILTHSMGGLTLIDALGILKRKGMSWKGKIVFIETPFNGAPKWKLKYTGFPVTAASVQDMFKGSDFMRNLDFTVLNGCQVLCILGSFSNKLFGIIGWLANPVMDPMKKVPMPIIARYPKIEHNTLLQHSLAGEMVRNFLLIDFASLED
jgi:hypothetical protein